MPECIRILIVDDHPVVRQGLRTFLSSRPDLEVVGEAGDGEAAVVAAESLNPDVVLMDLVMPGVGGVEAIRRLRHGKAPGDAPRVLVLTSFAGDDQVVPAIRAGAAGYLLKDAAPDELEAAIRVVHAGGTLLAPRAAAAILAELDHPASVSGVEHLTHREHEVLGLLGRGLSNRDIAGELFIAEKTVKTHVSAILTKLHVGDRTQAALVAVRMGLDRG